ncbi:AraC family transcriptional regulator [Paenibacillus glycinis]|uniref:Helix-turn-helix domain-containing protein n=1 Tax=Paenibacillus glycinis TaxID=2697035 RepID=A0ABW9Y0G4_9BACL|nr:AraC family transcriptional regulator [Paenibacillus glycinis]NBD28143.1 helix-turn-helix domain-containing protein [Paenibacillus glycinis]
MENRATDAPHDLSRLLELASRYSFIDGTSRTEIPYLTVLKEIKPIPVAQGVLGPSFCAVIQGKKLLQVGQDSIEYGAGNYLASSIHMPLKGTVLQASPEQPYVALQISLTAEEVTSVALEAKVGVHADKSLGAGAFVGEMNVEALEVIERLLRISADSRAIAFLAPALKRELLFRLLTGAGGDVFYNRMLLHQEAAGIQHVIQWITAHYDSAFTIRQLADLGNMSVSNLHHKFKAVTAMTPLQYQKRIRLQEAKRLLMGGNSDVTRTASQVGYESATQFIREYKRLFGLSPLRDVRAGIAK